MRKKLFTILVSILMIIPTLFGLVGCGKSNISYDDYEEIKTIASTIIKSYDTLTRSENVSTSKKNNNVFSSTSSTFSVEDVLEMLESSENKIICNTEKTWFETMTTSMFAIALAGGKLMADEYKDPNYFGTVLKAWEGNDTTGIAYEHFQLKRIDQYNKVLYVCGPDNGYHLKMSIYFKDRNDFNVEYISYTPNGSDSYESLDYWYADSTKKLMQVRYNTIGQAENYSATWHDGIDTFQIENGLLGSSVQDCIDYIIEKRNPMQHNAEIEAIGSTSPRYSFHYDKMWESFNYFMGDLLENLDDSDTGTPFTNMIIDGTLTGINYAYVTEEILTLPVGIDSITWGLRIPNTVKKVIIPNNVKTIKISLLVYNYILENAGNTLSGFTPYSGDQEYLRNTYVEIPFELANAYNTPLFMIVGPNGELLEGDINFKNIEFSTTSKQTLFSYLPDLDGLCVNLKDSTSNYRKLCFVLNDTLSLLKNALKDVTFNNNSRPLVDYALEKITHPEVTILQQTTSYVTQQAFNGAIDLASFVETVTINITSTNNWIDFSIFSKKDPTTQNTIPDLFSLDKITLNCTLAQENIPNIPAQISIQDSSIKSISEIEINSNAENFSIFGNLDNYLEVGAIYFNGANVKYILLENITLKSRTLTLPASTICADLTKLETTGDLTVFASSIMPFIKLVHDLQSNDYNDFDYEYYSYQTSDYKTHNIVTGFELLNFPAINGNLYYEYDGSLETIAEQAAQWTSFSDFTTSPNEENKKIQKNNWLVYNILRYYPDKINFICDLSALIFDGTKIAEAEYEVSLGWNNDTINPFDYFYTPYETTFKLSRNQEMTDLFTGEELSLDVGDNIFYLEITSADELTTKKYKINYKRPGFYSATFTDYNEILPPYERLWFDGQVIKFTLPMGYEISGVCIKIDNTIHLLTDIYPNATFTKLYDYDTNNYIYIVAGLEGDVDFYLEVTYRVFHVYATIFNQREINEPGPGMGSYYQVEMLNASRWVASYTINDQTITLPVGGVSGYKVTGGIYRSATLTNGNQGSYYVLSDKLTTNTLPVADTYGMQIYVEGAEEKIWNIEYHTEGFTQEFDYSTFNGVQQAHFNSSNNCWDGGISCYLNSLETGYKYIFSLYNDYSESSYNSLEASLTTIEQVFGYNTDTITIYVKKQAYQYSIYINLPLAESSLTVLEGFETLESLLLADGFISPYSPGQYIKYYTIEDSVTLPSLESIPDEYDKTGYFSNNHATFITHINQGTTEDIYLDISYAEKTV